MVVIIGLAMTAGSKPSFFAPIGSRQPTIIAMMTVQNSVTETTAAIIMLVLVKMMMRRKLTSASAAPETTATPISLISTRGQSRSSISPSARLRMTVTEVWLPELPALSISIGMNAVSSTAPESSVSKWVMMVEVNVAEIISSISHGRRCATRLQTLVFI